MSPSLPQRADPWQLCAKRRTFVGRLDLGTFERLAPLLASSGGEAAFTLSFTLDEKARALVHGRIEAELPVTCQRCLGTLVLSVREDFRLGLVRGPEEAEILDDELDPLLIEDGQVNPRDIIEDELILAVPITPRHSTEACPVRLGRPDVAEPDPDEEAASPFAILAALKQGKDDS